MTAPVAPQLRVLVVEDNPGDVVLLEDLLRSTGRGLTIDAADDLAGAVRRLAEATFDAVLLDLRLPDGEGVACVEAIRARADDAPIVVLTGLEDEAQAVACIAAGAQDYVVKSELRAKTILRAIDHAIARVGETRERRRADALQAHLAAIVESSSDGIVSATLEGVLMTWNAGAARIFGYAPEEAIGRRVTDIIRPPDTIDEAATEQRIARVREAADRDAQELVRLRKDGTQIVLSSVACPLRRPDGSAFGVAAILRDVTESRRRDEELRTRNAELEVRASQMRALTARMLTVREEERTRISREVHDELGQLLTGIKMDLRWIGRRIVPGLAPAAVQEVSARLTEVDALVNRTIETVQRIAVELRPSVLDALGLPAALRDEARRFGRRTGNIVELDVEVAAPPTDIATTLFRVAQELLTNVARHASASRVHIRLDETAAGWRLTVADDGVGVRDDPTGKPTSLGLLGIQERLNAVGGSFQLTSERGGGTVAIAQVPLRELPSP